MTVKEKFKSHPGVVDYFKEFPFYNKHIEEPRVKKSWFDFWTSFSWISECNKNKSCIQKICNELQNWISWEKWPNWKLEASKSSIKDF